MTIKCNYEGCNETTTGKDILPEATFICKNHTPAAEKDISFQSFQFDAELEPGSRSYAPGFQIIDPRNHETEVPDWTKTDEGIQKILLRSFPKLETNEVQRFRASRWARVIYLYYRMKYTQGQIADEMLIDLKTVNNILSRIALLAAGKRANGSGIPQP